MFASLSRHQGYQQITEILRFDFLMQVHVLLTCHAVLDVMNKQFYRLQTRFRQPGSKNDKPPSGGSQTTMPLGVSDVNMT